MDFILGTVKVLIGTFVLFTVARITYGTIGQRSGWAWVTLVCALAIANMVIHRLLGSTINPPFFTAVWFGIVLSGLTSKESPTVAPWYKRAIYAVVLGTVMGWASYAEVSSV
ncbi:hypothetical protein [Methyloglobulus sp.]|uniref:hypothetical protein n=1 Tax=Methyloglobulus sp. TaxID=2518622 RepID=UPI0017A6F5B1|nr:hypothetical protein [Methyloglobulus sp.]